MTRVQLTKPHHQLGSLSLTTPSDMASPSQLVCSLLTSAHRKENNSLSMLCLLSPLCLSQSHPRALCAPFTDAHTHSGNSRASMSPTQGEWGWRAG